MGSIDMDIEAAQQLGADPLPFARSYQLEALEKAIKQNTIVFLETGSGKTLIAIMLLRSFAYLLRKPSPFIAVFLVPKVVLVKQQAEAVETHTDLKVGKYWGEMGVDFWDAAIWNQEIAKHEVLVMTPQILLDGLRHRFFKLELIKVLIFDECHHASGNDPYACILNEFYHRYINYGINPSDLPRIFGMTASPIKSKGANSGHNYWKSIQDLENLMCSKVYTCYTESILSDYISFSKPKLKYYGHVEIPYSIYAYLADKLKVLKAKYEFNLKQLDLLDSSVESINKKITKMHSTFMYCLDELGVWFAFKAAEILSFNGSGFLSCGKLDAKGESVVKRFSSDASQAFENSIGSAIQHLGSKWSIGDNLTADTDAGLLTAKVICLIESLLDYRDLKDMRCIVFVERIIAAMVIQSFLSEFLPRHNGWKTKYIAGSNSGLQTQTRKTQNEIVEEFREGKVNIIIATSILEEGLDVQSCNVVIRFDPSATVSSFIQSRGRARMPNSDYLLMLKIGDHSTYSRLQTYLVSGEIMRKESLRHAAVPCSPLRNELRDDEFYCVEHTEAIVTLSSSISLVYFYCSRHPSDGYFKPTPRCLIDKETETCTLILPKSCPIQTITLQGNLKNLKQKVCLEACKQLHQIGALTDYLVPEVLEEANGQDAATTPYDDQQPMYFPPELVCQGSQESQTKYFCYLIELNQNFVFDIPVHNIVLLMRSELDRDILTLDFDLEVDGGLLTVKLKYIGELNLTKELVHLCRRFCVTLFKVLMDRSPNKLEEIFNGSELKNDLEIDYLLLPSINICQKPSIDWHSVTSVLFKYEDAWNDHSYCPMENNARIIQTKNGPVCNCMLQNSLVHTPHTGKVYCIKDIFSNLDGHSILKLSNGDVKTYKEYYKDQFGIKLCYDRELFLSGRHVFTLQNYLQRCRQTKGKESHHAYVELPPELCCIIMSPISISTFYSFTFIPSILHRLESLLIAINLKKMNLDHCLQNITIPTMKVLEAITTKKCQEKFHLESLETLGDSFLKYVAGQQLFKTYQNHHEGLLSIKKDKLISNAALCRLGCSRKLPGFIRNEPFDHKNWMIPGDNSRSDSLREEFLSDTRKIYASRTRKLKEKVVADAVEALIGAYLSTGGEKVGILFLDWIGIKADFMNIPYERQFQVMPERLVNVHYLETLLKYKFQDPSLLVEALTHGSYMVPEVPRCYQRLEFLGDSVLDYLITVYLYYKYPGMSPGMLTDMRSASVNNDCYALSAIRGEVHKQILHASQKLQKDIATAVQNFDKVSSAVTFGWESDTSFPKVLGDVMESLAGAIYVDSGCNKDAVFQSIRPLLEPLVTPETIRLHPVRELTELCQGHHFEMRKPIVQCNDGMSSVTVEVETANGIIFKHTSSASDKKTAKRVAAKVVLRALKKTI